MQFSTHPPTTHRLVYPVAALLLVLAFSFTATAADRYPKINLIAGYAVDPDWPKVPIDIHLDQIAGVTVDSKGRVWLFNRADPPVQVYSPAGDFLFSWGDGLFKGPHYLRIDHEGNVWTTDFRRHLVRKFTQEGKLLLTLGTPDEAGDDESHLSGPTDVAVSPTGDVFVSDGYGNNRVVHFDRDGNFVKSFGGLGVDAGQLSQPHSIAMDSKGLLYVCERNNGRIQIFNQAGKSLGQWRNLINPWGIHITPTDDIFVCGSTPARWTERGNLGNPPHDQILMRFDVTGRALELWGFPLAKDGELEPGHLDWMHGMGFDNEGNLYVGDVDENSPVHRVQKFVRLPAER
ncbi:MAG: peptidyl-alpha-hydroxyglycine alpha-amidating lyase family protein [Candidatus Hydrogenedentes bacterium]|nr:peptidyl-alpha-hydroxyglycine alpha-amidating lyase family protein [Candidatus Hydrogenedentota bacterium]